MSWDTSDVLQTNIESRVKKWPYRKVGKLENRCPHTGIALLDSIARKPCDTVWERCLEEVDYQHCSIYLNTDMITRKENWNTFEDIPSKLPPPITNWYILLNRDSSKEDAAPGKRLMVFKKTKSTAIQTAGSNPIASLILRWHGVGVFSLVKDDYPQFFMQVPNSVVKMELSPLIFAPTPVSTIHTSIRRDTVSNCSGNNISRS